LTTLVSIRFTHNSCPLCRYT